MLGGVIRTHIGVLGCVAEDLLCQNVMVSVLLCEALCLNAQKISIVGVREIRGVLGYVT